MQQFSHVQYEVVYKTREGISVDIASFKPG